MPTKVCMPAADTATFILFRQLLRARVRARFLRERVRDALVPHRPAAQAG